MDLISSYNSILLFLKAYNENWPLGAIVTAFRDPIHFVRLRYRHCVPGPHSLRSLGVSSLLFRDPTHFVRLGYRHCYSGTPLTSFAWGIVIAIPRPLCTTQRHLRLRLAVFRPSPLQVIFGLEKWDKVFGKSYFADEAYSVVQTTDGGYAMAGRTKSKGAGGSDVLILKLDKNGELECN